MRRVFADTLFWVGSLYRRDQHHQIARRALSDLGTVQVVTSELVLVEVLDHACTGEFSRQVVSSWAASIWLTYGVSVIPQSRSLFEKALALFSGRADKSWSFTDCTSMVILNDLKISEVLTSDHHFEQAGFTILLK